MLLDVVNNDPDTTVRVEAIDALKTLGSKAWVAIPSLIKSVKSGEGFIDEADIYYGGSHINKSERELAMQGLVRMSTEAFPAVLIALEESTGTIRADFLEFLIQSDPPLKDTLPLLKKFLNDPEKLVRHKALRAILVSDKTLAENDPDVQQAFQKELPALLAELKNDFVDAQRAANILELVNPSQAAEALKQYHEEYDFFFEFD